MSNTDRVRTTLREAGLLIDEKGPSVLSFGPAGIDSRAVVEGSVFFALPGENTDGHRFAASALIAGAAAAMVSDAGVFTELASRFRGKSLFLVKDVLATLQTLAAARVREVSPWTVGITGSNGKTGTKNYCAAALSVLGKTTASRGNLNNLIGLPLSFFDLPGDTKYMVAEMGCSGFGEIAKLAELFEPSAGIITNIGDAHLEILGDRNGVAKAKRELAEALPPDGILLVCGDDPYAGGMAASTPAMMVRAFGFGEGNDLRLEDLGPAGGGRRMRVAGRDLRLRSPMRHSILQAGAAWLLARYHDADPDALVSALEAAEPDGNRSALYRLGDWTIMDDSYNANPDSLRAALEWLAEYPCAGRRWAVLGDMLEMGEGGPGVHAEFGRSIAGLGGIGLMTRGPLGSEMAAAAKKAGAYEALHFEGHRQLAAALRERLGGGDLILVKGSRGMKMEKVIEALEEAIGASREAIG